MDPRKPFTLELKAVMEATGIVAGHCRGWGQRDGSLVGLLGRVYSVLEAFL